MAFGWDDAIMIGASILGSQSSSKQASQMRGATREQIALQREQFEHARDLQEALLRQQEPDRLAAQRATRSLSMMAGLGDPGGTAPLMDQLQLSQLRGQLGETDPFIGGPADTEMQWRQHPDRRGFAMLPTETGPEQMVANPEFQRLEEEIAALESELGGEGGGADPFEGPRDITEMPGFDFTREQGLEALSHSGAARGMQLSGRQMEGITEFGQRHATTFRSQLLNELQTIAGMQPSTQPVTNMSNLATGQASAISPLLGQMGQIGAAETAGQFGNLGALLGQIDFGGGGGTNAIDPSVGGYGNMTFSPGGKF